MNKKFYEAPAFEEVELQLLQGILSGSTSDGTGSDTDEDAGTIIPGVGDAGLMG